MVDVVEHALESRRRTSSLGVYVRHVLSAEALQQFGTDGYLVVRRVVPERILIELDAEVDGLVATAPPPPDKVGFHHYFEDPARLPVASRALREGGVLALARELVAPLDIDLAFDHIQIATSIHGWDHEPGGGHVDGYGIPGQTEPFTFTMLAGIYLGDETEPGRGNLWVWPGSHLVHQRMFEEHGVDVLMNDPAAAGHPCLLPDPPDCGRGQPVLAQRGRCRPRALSPRAQPERQHVESTTSDRLLPPRRHRTPRALAPHPHRRALGVRPRTNSPLS